MFRVSLTPNLKLEATFTQLSQFPKKAGLNTVNVCLFKNTVKIILLVIQSNVIWCDCLRTVSSEGGVVTSGRSSWQSGLISQRCVFGPQAAKNFVHSFALTYLFVLCPPVSDHSALVRMQTNGPPASSGAVFTNLKDFISL